MHNNEIIEKLQTLNKYLSPERPIRNFEYLRGRGKEYSTLSDEISYFSSIPFIYGNRGVGKTSLARTVAQMTSSADREHIYAACSPNSPMLTIFHGIAQDLLNQAIQLHLIKTTETKAEYTISLKPSIRFSIEQKHPQIKPFSDINEAVRTLRDIDSYYNDSKTTIVIIDELEEMKNDDKTLLAHLIKQIGDQEFNIRFILAGIADSVHELIGTHASVPRYICEISLDPLSAQDLINIVNEAASAVEITIDKNILYRIAIIGNGYPHFAHLIGKSLLYEAVINYAKDITDDIYKRAITRAVEGSIEELANVYNTATQRRDDIYRYLIWSLADCDCIDIRTDDLFDHCKELGKRHNWDIPQQDILPKILQRLGTDSYGKIIKNTPKQGGSNESRYRYKRFRNNLMRGHVRLMAELGGYQLGNATTL
jgi:Cdc6-like AAA superfamily ATPase